MDDNAIQKTIELKDGRRCIIRNVTSHDAKDVLVLFNKINNETNFLLTYPDEKRLSIEEEKNFLK